MGEVKWENLDDVKIPLNKTATQQVNYTRGILGDITTLDDNFIADAKLAIHGSTGAQLFNYNPEMIPTTNKIYTFPLNVGDGHFTASSNTDTSFSNTGAYIFIAQGNLQSPLELTTVSNGVWSGKSRTVESVDGYITIAARKSDRVNPFDNHDIMVNKGTSAIPYEPYTGGTPYTDKWTSNITDQTEDSVTLSIKNVSESVGDTTTLDVVLTDRNGVTKRSEQGKKFIGG